MGSENGLDFSARLDADGVVHVTGDVDIVTAALLEQELRAAAAATTGDLVVDVAAVSFMDSAGMNVLVRIYKLLDTDARTLAIRNPITSVRRALEIGGASAFADLR